MKKPKTPQKTAKSTQLVRVKHHIRRMESIQIPGTPFIMVANTKAECRELRAALESSLTRHVKDIPAYFKTRVRTSKPGGRN